MGDRLQAFFARWTSSGLVWVVLIGFAFALPILRSVRRELPEPPPDFGRVPDFSLIDQDGEEFTPDRLRGRVWVANFIFTSCGEVCPRLSERMRELQERLTNMGAAVQLVSFSVDPARDTPEKLKAYAERHTARKDLWTFVTGPIDRMERAVVDGFKMAMERQEVEGTGFFDIVHGERFVLVDQLGHIRGYYSTDDEDLQSLLNQLGLLANLGPRLHELAPSVLSSMGAGDSPPSR